MTKVAVTISVLTVACLVLPIGIMSLAEAVEDEELLQQIRETMQSRPEPSGQTPTDVERKAMMELSTKHLENGLELSERFLSMYPESKKRDEAWMYKIGFLLGLRREAEVNAEIEAFLKAFPKSKYAFEIRSVKIGQLEAEGKYKEAPRRARQTRSPGDSFQGV